jgi:Peptidase MA superfamily
MRRLAAAALAVGLALAVIGFAAPSPVAAFSGFGARTATEQYGQQMTFTVALTGGAPDQLQILLQFGPDPDSTFVAPVSATGSSATYTWDASSAYVTPNTPVTYRWRATTGGVVTVSPAATLLYADNRPGLDWQSRRMGQATVHWYGNAASEAQRFGTLTGGAVSRAEQILGHSLDGPIDIFVYATQSDFFGALGPGAREWTGAATFPTIRTVFMWLGGGSSSYLDTALIHEVTHVVFYDATNNPYHTPASWLNEGFAVWSQSQNADAAAQTVRSEVSSGLFSFDAITGQFPIGSRGSSLSYAEGATMVDLIIRTYGTQAMAKIAAAYRSGASDAEALQAGTGIPADQLYADYFGSFGATEPQPVPAATIGPSVVDTGAGVSGATQAPATSAAVAASDAPIPSGGSASADATATAVLTIIGLFVLLATAVAIGVWYGRRGRSSDG